MKKSNMFRKTLALPLLLCASSAISAAAKFASIKGIVQIYEKGKWVPASLAQKLETGVTIQTGYKSAAVIVFQVGGQMALAANTKVIVKDVPTNPGTNRDIYLEHGNVSAFVRKDLAAPNQYRVRTPTVLAGVRGSMLITSQTGDTGAAEAVESESYFEPTAVEDSVQKQLLEVQKIQAQIAGNTLVLEEIKVMEKDPAKYNTTAESLAARKKTLTDANTQLTIEVNVAMKELIRLEFAEKEAAKEAASVGAERDPVTGQFKLKQGDKASKSGENIADASKNRRDGSRPTKLGTTGQTETEQTFNQQNTDSQVGLGTDFQDTYSDVNSVTQPTTTGLPTLKKF